MTNTITSTLEQPRAELVACERKSLICAHAAEECTTALRSQLRAIVLTGSLARNEATFSARDEGCTFLSDADFLLVLEPHADDPSAAELRKLEQLVQTKLAQEIAISVHIGFATVFPNYFRSLPATTFTYELKNCGQVIWGDPNVLDLIPDLSKTMLSKEDGWRTLNHRIIELIATIAEHDFNIHQPARQFEYALVKLYLDMTTSYVLFLGCYQPTYARRLEELRKPAWETYLTLPRLDHTAFRNRVAQCTARKLRQTPFAPREIIKLFEEGIGYARELWFWEAHLLCGCLGSSRVSEVIAAMGRQQTQIQKLRAWSSLFRRARFSASTKYGTRWSKLYRLATPRYLLYGASFQLLRTMPDFLSDHNSQNAAELAEARALLPIPDDQRCNADWRSLAVHVSCCYQTFLMGTSS